MAVSSATRWQPIVTPFLGVRAAVKTAVFLLKVFPMLPLRPLDWMTSRPVLERLRFRTGHGQVEGDLYRPGSAGPHPGLVVCLGVVPFGVDHPQVPRLGEALARSGFAALLYWSPAMRDFRLDPADIDDIASAYDTLLARPEIDPARSGSEARSQIPTGSSMGRASPRVGGRSCRCSRRSPPMRRRPPSDACRRPSSSASTSCRRYATQPSSAPH